MTEKEERKLLSRRETLGLMGAAALVVVVGCADDDDGAGATQTPGATASGTGAAATTAAAAATTGAATTAATTAPAVSCVVTAAKTEGPYFVDEKLNRSDIRSDPTSGAVSEGIPLTLTLTVSEVDGETCSPLAGAVVDMWHCDALGVYSDITNGAGQADTSGQKFLRGYQVTDDNGQVTFLTVFPGWYSGRAIHIHYKVRTDPDAASGHEFISQVFFEEETIAAVMQQSPYSQKGQPNVSNASDNIYEASLIVPLTAEGDGYTGTFHVGVNFV